MNGKAPYTPGKQYVLSGSALNDLWREIQTNRVTVGKGLRSRTTPGRGSEIWLDPATANPWPWQLVPAAEGEWKISRPGRIYTSSADLDSQIEIAGLGSSFALEAEACVYLKLTTPDEPALTLIGGERWEDWPLTFKTVEPPDPFAVTEAYFLLWDCIAGPLPEGETGISIGDFHARRTGRSTWLESLLIWGAHQFDADHTHIEVPWLAPL